MAASSPSVGSSQNRFWTFSGSSSSDESSSYSDRVSDDEITPPGSPRKKQMPKLSPVKQFRQLVIELDPECSLTRSEMNIAKMGLTRLQGEIHDGPGPDGRSWRTREIFSNVCRTIISGAKDPVDADRKAVKMLTDNPFLDEVVAQLSQIDSEVQYPASEHPPIQAFVDVDHIFNFRIRGGVISGLHHIPPLHPHAQDQFNRINFGHGIYVASVKIKGIVKRASFFSDQLSQVEVLDTIKSTIEFTRSNERRLCRGDGFFIEVIRRNAIFKTGYPIVFYKQYSKGSIYEIKDGSSSVSADVLLAAAKKLIQHYHQESRKPLTSFINDPVRYSVYNGLGGKELIVELADILCPEDGAYFSDWQKNFRAEFGDALPISSVPKGLYFQIPLELVSEAPVLLSMLVDD